MLDRRYTFIFFLFFFLLEYKILDDYFGFITFN